MYQLPFKYFAGNNKDDYEKKFTSFIDKSH